MKQYEFSARTQDEAVEMGLQELGVSIADVDIQVVEEGSKGLFGLFGSRPVKVRLTLKDAEEDPLADLLEDKKPAKPQIEPEKKQEKKPEKKAEKKPVEKKAEEKKPAPEKKKAEKKAEPAEKKEQEKPAVKAEIRPMEKPEVTMIAAEELTDDSPAGTAHAFLAELTKLMGVDVTIDMGTDAEGNVYGYINGDTLGILIGRRGETLDAVQYLTSLKVNRGREGYTRVTLDTENYRAKREDTLIRLANRMANRALRTGRKVSLEPMNPYERRIIHYALQQTEGVTTHSEGEEPNRHVVITNKK
ncbi:RNA-binding cell elongation regulator Jag/EloR [Aristaeella hokkaidonensis]|jgi:spoIIIJ-associated protein|uniref:Protein jag n=1 Tax=Aristaeella hokkaidonensis TaxID=3046382 RepID=A0AC61MW99_9FIRM|nr:RNA-binding cell elongation regulator Jag/EloR [Aristaeella hokkaidonensis]QUC66767.1 protein jag [Aristaeella hokkaidonensis]SNT94744.1 spoIIIJ-associated protein [Aristaeella hokkaidonensis]